MEEDHEEHAQEHEEEEEAFGTVDNTDSETQGGALGLSWIADRGYVGVAASAFDSNYGIPGHHHHHEEEAEEPRHEEEEEAVRIDLEQRRVDLRGEYRFDAPIRLAKLSLARSDYEHLELEGPELGTRFDTAGTDARLELQHATIGRLQGAFGFQSRKIDFDAVGEEAYVPPSETFSNSVFLFEEYGLNDRWVLQASARAERQTIEVDSSVGPEYGDTAFGASIGAIWTFTEDASLSANYASTERHPTPTELFASGPHLAVSRFERGSLTLGEGFLDKETSSNLDVTLRTRNGPVEWSVTGFVNDVNDVNDYILLAPTGEEEDGLPVFEYTQTDARFYGYEAEARVALVDAAAADLHAVLFSDFVHAEDENTGAYIPRLSPLRYGVGKHYTAGPLAAGIEGVFHDEQDRTAPNELPTDGYLLLGAHVSYRLDERGLFVFLRGTNLTDEDARQHSSPLKDRVPLPGRSIHFGLRYDF